MEAKTFKKETTKLELVPKGIERKKHLKRNTEC